MSVVLLKKGNPYSDRYLGKYFESNNCGRFKVISYISARKVEVQFEMTGYKVWTRSSLIDSGEIKDPFQPTCFNVGYIGKGEYTTGKGSKDIKVYRCWSHMLERCYSDTFHSSSAYKGRGVTVCNSWHNYQEFAKWYYDNYREGTEIDKDLSGGLIYSPDSCYFLPKQINSALTLNRKIGRELPIGVSTKKDCKGFVSSITLHGKSKHLGVFKTKELAFNEYKITRKYHLRSLGLEALSKGQITEEIFNKIVNIKVVPYP